MIADRLDRAREAFEQKDLSATIKAHQAPGHEHHIEQGQYLKSLVYGGLDGTVTTFAVVAGVTGASLSYGTILIIGFANLLGDGLSMAIGDYLSTRSEQQFHRAERAREEWEVEKYPEGEKNEMIDIYKKKGYSAEDASSLVNVLFKNTRHFIDDMMIWELGILDSDESPLRNAIVTFFSFQLFGLVPLLAYLLLFFFPQAVLPFGSFAWSSVLTAFTLFALGALRVKFTNRNLLTSGLEMLLVGGLAAVAAYGIGYFLAGLA